jgi:amino acid transporter
VNHTTGEPPTRRRLDSRVRRSLELFFLGMTLVVGVVVVGGCGAIAVGLAEEQGPLIALALFAGGLIVVGFVYLATSMSRDVRLLRQKLLDQEERNRKP